MRSFLENLSHELPDVLISQALVRRADGKDILDLTTRKRLTPRDYYCGNGALVARAACDCHFRYRRGLR